MRIRRSRALIPLIVVVTFPIVRAAAIQTAPGGTGDKSSKLPFVNSTVALDRETTVTIRHVDVARFSIGDVSSPPPISVSVTSQGKTSPEAIVPGEKDFPPWGYMAAFAQDLDDDGRKEACICSYCDFGGSGGARYLTLVEPRLGQTPLVWTLPRGEQENIHTSTFYLARDTRRRPGIVITHPLMDGETRADPTRWSIHTYRLIFPGKDGSGRFRAVSLGKKRTANRYSERVPESVARQYIPQGWSLSVPLY